MAHTLSAKKRIRQDVKRRARNRWRKDRIKAAIRAFEDALKEGDESQMKQTLQSCYRELDKVASKGTIHKNRAARKKARLTKAMNKALA